jgi:hypothetical protein
MNDSAGLPTTFWSTSRTRSTLPGCHPNAKTAISDLLDHFGRRPPAELIDLARRCGATP